MEETTWNVVGRSIFPTVRRGHDDFLVPAKENVTDPCGQDVDGGRDKHEESEVFDNGCGAHEYRPNRSDEDQRSSSGKVTEPGDKRDRTDQAGVQARFIAFIDIEAVPGLP